MKIINQYLEEAWPFGRKRQEKKGRSVRELFRSPNFRKQYDLVFFPPAIKSCVDNASTGIKDAKWKCSYWKTNFPKLERELKKNPSDKDLKKKIQIGKNVMKWACGWKTFPSLKDIKQLNISLKQKKATQDQLFDWYSNYLDWPQYAKFKNKVIKNTNENN